MLSVVSKMFCVVISHIQCTVYDDEETKTLMYSLSTQAQAYTSHKYLSDMPHTHAE